VVHDDVEPDDLHAAGVRERPDHLRSPHTRLVARGAQHLLGEAPLPGLRGLGHVPHDLTVSRPEPIRRATAGTRMRPVARPVRRAGTVALVAGAAALLAGCTALTSGASWREVEQVGPFAPASGTAGPCETSFTADVAGSFDGEPSAAGALSAWLDGPAFDARSGNLGVFPGAPPDGWTAVDEGVEGERTFVNGSWEVLTRQSSLGAWLVTAASCG